MSVRPSLLLERDDEDVDELDLVLEDVDEPLDGLLLLHEVVAEAGGVDDGEVGRGGVAEPVALVRARLLCDGSGVAQAHHLKGKLNSSNLGQLLIIHSLMW